MCLSDTFFQLRKSVIFVFGIGVGVMTKPTTIAIVDSGVPEFADAKGVRRCFGLSRSHLYQLSTAGKIRSLSIRRIGAVRGRRLFDCESIRAFLNSCVDHRTEKQEEGAL